jgi:hypothetical protein
MKKLIASLALIMVLFTSCSLLQSLVGPDKVLTTTGSVKKGRENDGLTIDPSKLSAPVQKFFEKNYPGESIVLISADAVKEGADAIPVTQEGPGVWASLWSLAVKFGGQVWPPLLALESIGLALFRRKRKHYGVALKSILPTNGKIEVVPALSSVARALGLSHSSVKTAEMFEKEEEKRMAKA